MNRLLFLSLTASALTSCSSADMDYFWNGDANYTPPAPRQQDNWLEKTRQSGEKARYEYDQKAFDQGRRNTIPDRTGYGF